MGKQKLSLMIIIRQFKEAVKKMKLLLGLWGVHSSAGRRRPMSSKLQRWRSFASGGVMGFLENKRRGRRRSSYGWEEDEDDINERAENFIASFRLQLSLERQMELRCCSSSGFGDDY